MCRDKFSILLILFILNGCTKESQNEEAYDQEPNIEEIITFKKDVDNVKNAVRQTNDGGYILCGERELQSGDEQIWLLKTNNQGDTIWTQTFGNPYGYGVAAKQTADGGYIITGRTSSFGWNGDVWIIKTNQEGEITNTFNILTSKSNKKIIKVTDLLGRETKQTNQPLFYIYDDGTVEKRIVIE